MFFEGPLGSLAAMFNASSDLLDSTLIETIRLPSTLLDALTSAGLKTVGEVRAATNDELHSIPDIGANTVTYLRMTLGHPARP